MTKPSMSRMNTTSKRGAAAVLKAIPPRDGARGRIFEIDFLRGFDIILMVLIHLVFAWSSQSSGLFAWEGPGPQPDWVIGMRSLFDSVGSMILGGSLYFLEFFFSGLFVFLSGISCSFSRSNGRRAAELGIIALGLTYAVEGADFLFHIGAHIYLGILHVIALSLALYALVDHFFPDWRVTFGVAIFLVVLTGITEWLRIRTGSQSVNLGDPAQWKNLWLCILGIRRTGSDYFSTTRLSAILFLGATVGKLAYGKRKSRLPASFPTAWGRPIAFLGRHTLLIYCVHVPLIYLLLGILMLLSGYTLRI